MQQNKVAHLHNVMEISDGSLFCSHAEGHAIGNLGFPNCKQWHVIPKHVPQRRSETRM